MMVKLMMMINDGEVDDGWLSVRVFNYYDDNNDNDDNDDNDGGADVEVGWLFSITMMTMMMMVILITVAPPLNRQKTYFFRR